MIKTVGRFTIKVFSDGYPVYCEITDDRGQTMIGCPHSDLSDLAYAVDQMRRGARERLANRHKDEV